jgi:hypothetical protein
MSPTEREELEALLNALCEESITPEQVRRLEEIVLAHPEAEGHYVQYMSLVADLSRHFATTPPPTEQVLRAKVEAEPPLAEPVRPATSRRALVRPWMVGVAVLAGCILLAIGLWPRPLVLPTKQNAPPERTDEAVAVLLLTHKAEWEETGMPTRPGSLLPPGRLVLKSGYAHLEFYNGATVILEGPAEFRLVSRTEAFCERGKLRATVPPQAHGFAIGSPGMDLVDRGTDFGLQVSGGKTAVHVFQGQVDVYEPGQEKSGKPRVLRTGEGVAREGPGPVNPIRPNASSFLSAAEMAARADADRQKRQQEWSEASKEWRKDPSLLVYYTFQPGGTGPRTLLDEAGDRRQPHDGALVGCMWGAGRWRGREGLEFKRASDRARLTVPGDFEAITLAAWVRPDALPNQNNSLMMADGWEPGELHWQIGVDGTIILAVKAPPELEVPMQRGAHYRAYNVLTPERFGRWVHLAVVYDPAAGRVTHYVDGLPVIDHEIEFDTPLRIGDAAIGNWNVSTFRNKHPIRNFNGAMDEFMLFSRALSGQEVERLYAQGRPPL